MNREDLIPHPLTSVPDDETQTVTQQKKFLAPQNLLSTPYSNIGISLGGVSASYTLAGNNHSHNSGISLQQIKDMLLQESRKGDLINSKERVSFNHGIISSCTYPSVSDGLNLNLAPSQVLSVHTVSPHQDTDESSDLTSIISMNSANAPRMTPNQEPFQGTTINDSTSLLRGSMSCENSLSELTPTITPVTLMETSSDSLIFEKVVFTPDQTFPKEAPITPVSKDDKEATSNASSIVSNNRLLSKLIQSYKPDTITPLPLPLRISEFTKIPNASLKPSLPAADLNTAGKISSGSSPSVMNSLVSTSSHELPLHNSLTDFSRTSVTNPVTNSLNPLSVMASSSCNTFPTSNHSVSLSSNSHALHHPIHSNQPLEDLPFTDHFQNVNQGRRVQACHEHDLNDPILAKPSSKRTMQTTNSEAPVDKDRFTFPHDVLGKVNSNLVPVLQPETRTEPLLMTGDQLIPENPITSHIDSTHALNFIPDQQILSHISQLHEIPSENVKENRSMRPVDMFLSDLHSTDDHDLLRASLSNTIVPDISSNLVSSNLVSSAIPVSSETTLSTSIGSSSHLPELPPSPILANISPDFLVGGGTSTTKTSPGSQPPFLPSLSTATENLALSFSSHFLDNSNMSIDMGSLSEGDASLNVPSHSFSESFDSSNPKRSSGNELTFTHALKNATEKGNFDQVKSNKVPGSDQSTSPSFTSPLQKGSSQSDNSFKTNSLLTNNPEIFKVPPQMKQLPSTDDASSPPSSISSSTLPSSLSSSLSSLSSCLSTSPSTKRHSFSAKEIPLIKIDSDSPPLPKSSPPKPESLVQQVSCFKCQLCSYLSLDKKDMNDHMKTKHNNALLETTTHNRSSSSSLSAKPTPTTTEESPPQPKKRKKTDPKNATTITKKTKTSKKKQSKKKDTPKTQCKVEMCPREKGGFQRRIVMIGQDEKERETRADSDSKSQIDFNSNEAVKSESDVMMDIKTDISVEDVPIPQQEDKRASFSGNETPLSSAGAEETPTKKTTLKPGRPAASQTMGIIKFKKSHPKVPIPEETLGIRCGVNGCGLRMKEEENILYHRKCHVEAFLKCPECHTKFTHWASLAMHLWRMHMVDMELHKCEKCNFKSYSYTKLMNGHWKTHSTERPFLCDVCGKDFKTAKQLRSHKILHVEKNEELKHHCDMCKRKFAEKRMLLLHLEAVHKKVKPYLCNYCGNSFASKSTLNLHIRKHTGEKPFACESCSYRTSDHNSMRRHKMKHTNDRPYSCPYCDYSSIQSSTFKVHLRRKHEVQAQKDGVIFSCSFCTFKTVKKDNFLAHVGTHHKITEEEQNKEAERQQQQITKQGNKKQGQKQQQHQQLEQQQQLQQQPTKQTEQQQQQQQRVTLTTTTDQQQQRLQQQPVLNQNLQQQHQQQQVVIAKNQVATALTTVAENNQNGAAAILVTNSNSKSEPHSQQQQQPMFYVFGELVPVPHVVNIDVNEAETTDMSTELVNSVLLQGNLQNSISGPVIMGSGEHYAYTNTEGALLQSVNINDGVVQLTPEVVAMPVTTDLPTPLTSQSVPGLIYVATSNEGDSTHCRLVQNSSLFS